MPDVGVLSLRQEHPILQEEITVTLEPDQGPNVIEWPKELLPGATQSS